MYLALYDEPGVWGTYYGPEMSRIDNNAIVRHAAAGAHHAGMHRVLDRSKNTARHPALRARYADMVWDLSQKATGTKPPIDAARIAIDGRLRP